MRFAPLAALLLAGCSSPVSPEAALRAALQRGSGAVLLPSNLILHAELALPEGAHDVEVIGSNSILRLAKDFRGRAVFTVKSGARIRFRDFRVYGERDALEQRTGLPGYDTPFHGFSSNNGILIEGASDVSISAVHFREVGGFPILVSGSKGVRIERVRIEDSGSRNPAGRNNTTGGILLEEGTANFQVLDSEFKNIRGNGVWTHSLYTSPRNADGLIAGNRFDGIGRDAIQVGHATRVRVERNTGERIGYPESVVDMENKAVPVAIDTAGNTDRSAYTGNRFTDVNGKCIDLDGFHHGEVTGNVCVNLRNFGVVMNNTNPDMQPEAVTIADNTIDGAAYGAIFVIGSGNRVLRNRLLHLNTAKCETCYYTAGEPDMLRSGIYLGRGAERPALSRGNVIEGNEISGFRMKTHCVGAAPGVSMAENRVAGNRCVDAGP
jgi:Right handed beta helix region